MIASCGKVCVAEVEHLSRSELDPDQIHTRHLRPTASSKARSTKNASSSARCKERDFKKENPIRELMRSARRQELRDGYYVNLGIGIPTLVANCIPEGMNVTLQSRERSARHRPFPTEDEVGRRSDQCRKATITTMARLPLFSRAPTRSR